MDENKKNYYFEKLREADETIYDLETKLNEIKQKNSQLQHDFNKMNAKLNKFIEINNDLELKMKEKDDEISFFKKDIKEKDSKIIKIKIDTPSNSSDELEKFYNNKKEKILQEKVEENNYLGEIIENLEIKNKNLNDDIFNMNNRIVYLENVIDIMEKDRKDYENINHALEMNNKKLVKQIQDREFKHNNEEIYDIHETYYVKKDKNSISRNKIETDCCCIIM